MKINLIYNYDLKDPIIYKKNNVIYIYDDNKKFILQKIDSYNELGEISQIINENKLEKNFYRIVKTKNNELTISYDQQLYVLLEFNNNVIPVTKKIKPRINYTLNRSNWYDLWIKKTNYIIEQYSEIVRKYPHIEGVIDYYIGMAENAIEYLKINNSISNNHEIYISYKRYSNMENPLNIVLDCKERLLAEKIKNDFFQLNKKIETISILGDIQKKQLSFHKVYARLLYPTYFFDILENIENKSFESKIKTIIKKTFEYEMLLKEFYLIFSKENKIKNIDWI